MNAAYAVVEARTADRQCRHVEFMCAVDESQGKKLLLRQTELFAQRRKVDVDRFGAEMIVSCRNGGVRSEHRICGDCFQRGVERQALRNQRARALEPGKPGVLR